MTIPSKLQVLNSQQTVPAAETLTAMATEVAGQDANLPGNPAAEAMHLLEEHKGKLAIGVAATLGLMVFYRWREKWLAKTDPEEYARLQRLKAVVRHSDDPVTPNAARKTAVSSPDKKSSPL